jgi:hypothetical protein
MKLYQENKRRRIVNPENNEIWDRKYMEINTNLLISGEDEIRKHGNLTREKRKRMSIL